MKEHLLGVAGAPVTGDYVRTLHAGVSKLTPYDTFLQATRATASGAALIVDSVAHGGDGNVLQRSKMTDGFVINKTTGAAVALAGWSVTDFMKAEGASQVVNKAVASAAPYGVAYYDGNQVYISGATGAGAGTVYNRPAGAVFWRAAVATTARPSASAYNAAALPGVQRAFGYLDSVSVRALFADQFAALTGGNLFVTSDITDGYYLDVNGVAQANAAFYTSGFIRVAPATQYVANMLIAPGTSAIVYYNEDQAMVSAVAGANIAAGTPWTTPADAVFMKVSISRTSVPKLGPGAVMIVKGAVLPSLYRAGGSVDAGTAKREAVKSAIAMLPKHNIFDWRKATAGQIISGTGVITANAAFALSPMIEVEGGSTISLFGSLGTAQVNGYGFTYFDKAGDPLSTDNNGGVAFTNPYTSNVPANAFGMKFCVSNANLKAVTLVHGATAPTAKLAPIGYDGERSKVMRGKVMASAGDSITAANKWQLAAHAFCDSTPGTNFAVNGSNMVDITATQITSAAQLVGIDGLHIATGTNDYGEDTPLGTIADTSAAATFYGHIRLQIETLINPATGLKPSLELRFSTPMQRNGWATPNGAGHTLKAYADAIIAVCREYAIPCLDLFGTSGLSQLTYAALTADGLHPNDPMYERQGGMIGRFWERVG